MHANPSSMQHDALFNFIIQISFMLLLDYELEFWDPNFLIMKGLSPLEVSKSLSCNFVSLTLHV